MTINKKVSKSLWDWELVSNTQANGDASQRPDYNSLNNKHLNNTLK